MRTVETTDTLKRNFNLQHSEPLFGIIEEMPLQCPRINQFQEDMESLMSHVEKLRGLLNEEKELMELNLKLMIREVEIINQYRHPMNESFEELRTACENLRSWGHGWKGLAKKLFSKVPNNKTFLDKKFNK